MPVLEILIALATLLIGVSIGAMVVGVADLLGLAGWIAGLGFALLVLAFLFVTDKMTGFEARSILRLIARLTRLDPKELGADKPDKTSHWDYLGFFVGTLIGILVSLLWSPEWVFDLLPI